MISVQKVDRLDGFDALRDDWDRLLAGSDFRTIFQTFDWLRTWWSVFGRDKELYILVVRSGGEITGIAPLMVVQSHRWGRRKKILQFLGTPNADYADVIGNNRQEILKAVVDYLVRNRGDWSRIELAQISEKSLTFGFLGKILESDNIVANLKEIEVCYGYEPEGGPEAMGEFRFRKSHSQKRKINHFRKKGGFKVERINSKEEAIRNLRLLFHYHVIRWNGTPTPSKFLFDENRDFYERLLEVLFTKGSICFMTAVCGSVPAAFFFNFEYDNTVYHYTVAHNRFFEHWSPGNVMAILQSEHLLRRGFCLDYSRGGSDYKNQLANWSSSNYQLTIYGNRISLWVSRGYDRVKSIKPVRKMLDNPWIQGHKLKLTGLLRNRGIAGAFSKIVGDLTRLILEYKKHVVFRGGDAPGTIPPCSLEIDVSRLDINDVEQVASFYGIEENSREHEYMVKRFQDGADCFGARHDGNIIGVGWGMYGTGATSGYNVPVSIGSGEVFIGDISISRVYNRQEILANLISYQTREYERKKLKAVCVSEASESLKIEIISDLGFERIAVHRELRLFTMKVI